MSCGARFVDIVARRSKRSAGTPAGVELVDRLAVPPCLVAPNPADHAAHARRVADVVGEVPVLPALEYSACSFNPLRDAASRFGAHL